MRFGPRVRAPLTGFLTCFALIGCAGFAGSGCGGDRAAYPTAEGALQLERVVLYRNGVGYFERVGQVDGNMLHLRIRKDQVNDLLKSLTVVERAGGKAVSVSMPLDPQTWANAALASLSPGNGNLAQVLDSLRGTDVSLQTTEGTYAGRIVMVEYIEHEPDPSPPKSGAADELGVDHKVTLLDGSEMSVVRLSKVRRISLKDGDLAMQFHRRLDATAGEGMFQQVDVQVRLAGDSDHDVLVSYVVSAPMWKPTYRVVLPEANSKKALLQGWAVVDNTSGEDWREVQLALTSGAPIAFRYDLHTPRDVPRADLTERGVRKQARVALGEATYGGEDDDESGDYGDNAEAPIEEERYAEDPADMPMANAPAPAPSLAKKKDRDKGTGGLGLAGGDGEGRAQGFYGLSEAEPEEQKQAIDFESLRRSTMANARASQISGLSQFNIEERITVPDGSATMVALINAEVEAEETFLFRPGGAGIGYETNPYRVVRFKNSTPFVLESGPISIYSGGSFVGEGLSEPVGTKNSATIPFAVEPGVMVTSNVKRTGDDMRLVKIVRGVLHIESFAQTKTTWTAKGQSKDGFKVLIRHSKSGWNYELVSRPEGTEDLPDGYLIPLVVPAGQQEAELVVDERTPSKTTLSIWDGKAVKLLEDLFARADLDAITRSKLEPIVKVRSEIGKIDTRIAGLTQQRDELDQRADQTRQNLEALKEDPKAEPLRAKLRIRLDEFQEEGNKLGREIVELSNKRLELKIELEDKLESLELDTDGPPNETSEPAPDQP